MDEGCNYTTPDGEYECKRQKASGSLCVFHLGLDDRKKPSAGDYFNQLKELVDNKDTRWAGFIFPENSKLYDLVLETPVDLRWSKFESLTINNIQCYEKFDMRHSVVNGRLHVSKANFDKDADFYGSSFNNDIDINARYGGRAGFHGCDFFGRASFLGKFSGGGTFHMTRFHEAATFRGGLGRIISPEPATFTITTGNPFLIISNAKGDVLSRIKNYFNKGRRKVISGASHIRKYAKSSIASIRIKSKNHLKQVKRRLSPLSDNSVDLNMLFDSEIQMIEVEFRRPGSTRFMGVDMSRVSLVGTDMKGVHFYDVKFYQPALKRQGLWDEVSLLNSQDYSYRYYMWPRIESEYRNLRVALESNKDFSTATDFYVGEMDIRRRQMGVFRRYLLSIEALYHALSNYGASPFTAIRIFSYLVVMHALITMMYVVDPSTAIKEVLNVDSEFPLIEHTCQLLTIYLVNSLKVLTFQRGDVVLELTSFSGHVVDAIFRIFGPVQLALIALAIRVKIKRH